MRTERGSMTLWMLGLSLILLLFGGLGLDFWRGLALQRALAAIADSAAVAAASGVDEAAYRVDGHVVLDPARAASLAEASISFQDLETVSREVTVDPSGLEVTVRVQAQFDPMLIGVFIADDSPLLVRAESTAAPRVTP